MRSVGPFELLGEHVICPICQSHWTGGDGGTVDHVWCNHEHPVLWRAASGRLSLELGPYDVRWKCSCMVPECEGKNVIYERADDAPERFVEHDLPFNVTLKQVEAWVTSHDWIYPP